MNVLLCSSMSAVASPVSASTAMTRSTWCPRWLYRNVNRGESGAQRTSLEAPGIREQVVVDRDLLARGDVEQVRPA